MKAKIGTLIHATMRPEDLIPCFAEHALALGHALQSGDPLQVSTGKNLVILCGQIMTRCTAPGYFDTDDSCYDLDDLFNWLNDLAPEGCYFGAHPGDGSDYGYWPADEY